MFLRIFETDWTLCDGYSTDKKKELIAVTNDIIYTSKNMLSISDDVYGNVKLYPAFSPNKLVNKGFAKEEAELIKFIKNAKDHLFINYYSYSTKGTNKKTQYLKIDNEIRKAAGRGVEVKIVFSDWAIKKDAIEQIKDLSRVKGIEIKFSTIPQHSSGFIPYSRVQHCKVMIADDDMSWISTSNLERDYFFESRNATLIIESEKVNEELEKIFMRVWNSNYVEKVDINKEYKPVKRN
jgi:phosphatidylserine/phosphatidylglycerophosphate/cardiolipin synthase-like enzyme